MAILVTVRKGFSKAIEEVSDNIRVGILVNSNATRSMRAVHDAYAVIHAAFLYRVPDAGRNVMAAFSSGLE